MPNWKKIALSGSSPEFSSLTVDGAIEASKFSGSFSGSFEGDGSSLTGIDVGEVTLKSDTFTSVTSKSVSHTFGTKDVNVTVYDSDDKLIIPSSVTTTDTSTVDLTFDTATTGRVVITKGGHIVTGSIDITSQSTATDSFTSETSYTSSHTFGTTDVFVQVYDDTDSLIIPQKIKILTTSSIGLDFDTATSGKIIIGKSGHIVSGSAEVSTVAYSNVTSKPALISSSAQIAADISGSSDGAISSSAQIGALGANIVSSSQGVVNLGANIVSSSAQTILNVAAGGAGIVSASAGIANLGAGIVSASGNVAALAAGIVSSSNQFQTLSLTNTTTDDTILLTTTEDSSTAGPVLTLKRNSSSPADADYLGQIKFKGENDADQEVVYAKVTGKILDASDGSEDGIIEVAHKKAGSNTITGRWRSDSLQLLNDTNLTVDGQISASSLISNNFSGSFQGDGSDLTGVTTASLALTASYVDSALTSSYVATALTASYVHSASIDGTVLSSSYAATSSRSVNKNTNSGSICFWQGSQSEYDALGSYDSSTVYFVV